MILDRLERQHKPISIKMIDLKGITWDHPRGYEPLKAASEEFSKKHPNVRLNWKVRSLKEFGDMPIEDLIEKYDIITIDHPYMGQALQNNLLVPLEKILSHDFLTVLDRDSVGPSFQSYFYKDHLFALPIDAAALVSSFRRDLLKSSGLVLPKTRQELMKMYEKNSKKYAIAWPLCPTDLWCSFLSLCAQDGGKNFIYDFKINEHVGMKVLDEIKFHMNFIHPDSLQMNPIQVLDRMSNENEIIYAPYLFGYTNYCRPDYSKNLIDFTNSPVNPEKSVSTILGGVGLSISVHCKPIDEALEFLKYVSSPSIQSDIYTKSGGQPASLSAWNNEENNKLCNCFFKDTIKTMKHAYVRPRHPGWNTFQEKGAELLHNGLLKGIDSKKMIEVLNQLYKTHRPHYDEV